MTSRKIYMLYIKELSRFDLASTEGTPLGP